MESTGPDRLRYVQKLCTSTVTMFFFLRENLRVFRVGTLLMVHRLLEIYENEREIIVLSKFHESFGLKSGSLFIARSKFRQKLVEHQVPAQIEDLPF